MFTPNEQNRISSSLDGGVNGLNVDRPSTYITPHTKSFEGHRGDLETGRISKLEKETSVCALAPINIDTLRPFMGLFSSYLTLQRYVVIS